LVEEEKRTVKGHKRRDHSLSKRQSLGLEALEQRCLLASLPGTSFVPLKMVAWFEAFPYDRVDAAFHADVVRVSNAWSETSGQPLWSVQAAPATSAPVDLPTTEAAVSMSSAPLDAATSAQTPSMLSAQIATAASSPSDMSLEYAPPTNDAPLPADNGVDRLLDSQAGAVGLAVHPWLAAPTFDAHVVDSLFGGGRGLRLDSFESDPADGGHFDVDHPLFADQDGSVSPAPETHARGDFEALPDPQSQLEAFSAAVASGAANAAAPAAVVSVRSTVVADGAHAASPLAPRLVPGAQDPEEYVRVASVDGEAPLAADDADDAGIGHAGAKSAATRQISGAASSASPIAGLLPVDLPTLARNADRFFAKLSKLGKDWNDPRLVAEMALWSAALAAGAYEIMHLRAKRSTVPSFADDGEVSSLIVPSGGDRE
jgi:hypothetical protein